METTSRYWSGIASYLRCFNVYLFILLIHLSKAQIPENLADSKVIFIGDVHVDADIFTNLKASGGDLICIERLMTEVSFNKAIYLIEAPVSVQYYIRKYFETADTSFFGIIANLRNEVYFIRYLNEVKKLKAENFFCYDADTRAFKRTVIDVLYYLFFYEPYKKSFKDGDFRKAGQGSDDYNKNVVLNDKLIDSLNLSENVSMMNNLVWNSRYRRFLNSGKLKKKFNRCLNDTACMRGLETILGDNYSYCKTLLKSYTESADLNLKKERDYTLREKNTAEVISDIIKSYGNNKQVIIKCGINHSFVHDSTTLAYRLSQLYGSTSIYMMYANYRSVYPARLNKYFGEKTTQWLKLEKNEFLYFCD